MPVEAPIPERPVEDLDIGIVRRLPWPAEVDPDTMVISPKVYDATGKFPAIVGKQVFRRSALPHQAVEHLCDMLAIQTLPHLDGQCPAAEDVDHRQHPELLPVAQLVMDEVRAPCVVRAAAKPDYFPGVTSAS